MMRVRLLIGAVIGMGVLILIAVVMLVVGIIDEAGETTTVSTSRSSLPQIVGDLRSDPVSLGLPAGAKVLRMTDTRSGLAILVAWPDGSQVIFVVPIHRKGPALRISVSNSENQ
ncbi:MAG: hypothetical protein OXC93_06440 [Rhodospirillaceae bacterium]|nr:hypothetical protein [Rhodospirillaceae bacterium]